jgi:hypothetical protein
MANTPKTVEITRHPEEDAILKAANGNPRNRHNLIGEALGIAIVEEVKPTFEDAPFTYVLKNEKGEWRRSGAYTNSAESAMLFGIGHKAEGSNSKFGYFATKMLAQ